MLHNGIGYFFAGIYSRKENGTCVNATFDVVFNSCMKNPFFFLFFFFFFFCSVYSFLKVHLQMFVKLETFI